MTFNLHHGDCLDVMRGMAENSVDSIVCDPPYGLSKEPDMGEVLRHWLEGDDYKHKGSGFMGKSWDSFVPGPTIWKEAYRVLKPGGHLLAFAGSRTQDLMGIAIRLAGFENRDCLMWVFGSGFPKSLDVGKAIDSQRKEDIEPAATVAKWINRKMPAGLNMNRWRQYLNGKIVGESHGGGSAQGWTTEKTDGAVKPRVPTWEQWQKMKTLLELPDDMDAEVWRLNGRKGKPGDAFADREVVGEKTAGMGSGKTFGMLQAEGNNASAEKKINITAPATEAAKQWDGFGTALKPAYEPCLMFRKPLAKGNTVAANVMEYGTGGLNIDASRVSADGGRPLREVAPMRDDVQYAGNSLAGRVDGSLASSKAVGSTTQGRWPANLILSYPEDEHDADGNLLPNPGKDEVVGLFPVTTSGARSGRSSANEGRLFKLHGKACEGSQGSAARFFYTAKASKRDRNCNGAVNNIHPTCKPESLMRYLCRLVTPPNGTCLDPFMGSGSTGKAAILEGFNFIGIEMDAEYIEIARARIEYAASQPDKEPELF